jgi:hypothetical protein
MRRLSTFADFIQQSDFNKNSQQEAVDAQTYKKPPIPIVGDFEAFATAFMEMKRRAGE